MPSVYKHREGDLLYARLALLERLASAAQIQKAMGLLRRIAEAGGTAPPIGEILIGEKILSEDQHKQLLERLEEANQAITEAQAGLHEVPRRVGRYELLERIGRGGMGAVYRARQLNMDRIVALKVLAPHLTRDTKYVKQFIREARVAGQINHANIVAVHEVGEADGHFFISMEFVNGRPLSRELLARRRLPVPEVLGYAEQVASALAAIEKHGIVHRDIKPDNIMLTPKGQIKVTDLGLAKRLTEVSSAGQTGWACGTPYYMAPEQARDSRRVDIRADIYSLGASLYHLLTGKLPFEGGSSVEVLMRAATERLVPPAILCPEVPQVFSDLIERMMSREAEDRPQSAAELAAELAAVRREIEAPASKRGRRASRRSALLGQGGIPGTSGSPAGLLLSAAWAAAALAVVGLIIELASPPRSRPSPPTAPPVHRPQPPPPPKIDPPEPPEPEAGAQDAEMRVLLERLRSATAAAGLPGYAALLGECDARLTSAGRWRPALVRAREDLAARAEALAQEALSGYRWLAAEALAECRPDAGLAELSRVGRLWPGTVAARSAAAERAALAERAGGCFQALDLRAAEMLAAERFDRAAQLLEGLRTEGCPGSEAWKRRAAARLAAERQAAEARQEALRQERGALADKLGAIEKRLAVWDFAGAQALAVETLKVLPAESRARRRLDLAARRAETLAGFLETLCEHLNTARPRLEDKAFADTPLGLTVVGADKKGLKLLAADKSGAERDWVGLSATERLKLALVVVAARTPSAQDLLALGLLEMGAGRSQRAALCLDQAEKLGAAVAGFRQELQLLAAGDAEAAAERLETQARRRLDDSRPAEALADLGRLLVEFRGTGWVAERSGVLERLVAEAERDARQYGLFSARALEPLPGRLILGYDFSDARAAGDWRLTGSAARPEEGPRPARLEWLPTFTGEFSARFSLAGEAAGAGLELVPQPAGSAGTVRLGAAGLSGAGLPAGEPAARDAPAGGAEPAGRALELEMRGGEFRWRAGPVSGRAQLPPELLGSLAGGRVTGWRLALEMPAGSGRVASARLDCRLPERELELLREARAVAADARWKAALRVTDPGLRAADMRRVAGEYRDVAALAARAELTRAAALLEAGQSAEARRCLEELLATYPSQGALFPSARQLLETIGKAR